MLVGRVATVASCPSRFPTYQREDSVALYMLTCLALSTAASPVCREYCGSSHVGSCIEVGGNCQNHGTMDVAKAACIVAGDACVGIQTDSDSYGSAPSSQWALRTGSATCVSTGASDWSLKKECCVTYEAGRATWPAYDQASGANPRPLSEQAGASNGTVIDFPDHAVAFDSTQNREPDRQPVS